MRWSPGRWKRGVTPEEKEEWKAKAAAMPDRVCLHIRLETISADALCFLRVLGDTRLNRPIVTRAHAPQQVPKLSTEQKELLRQHKEGALQQQHQHQYKGKGRGMGTGRAGAAGRSRGRAGARAGGRALPPGWSWID